MKTNIIPFKIKKIMDTSDDIKRLYQEIGRLELKQKKFDAQINDFKLADVIHAKVCKWNHSDCCAYEYQSWDNIGTERSFYLDKAKSVLKIVSYDTAIKVIKCL